MASLAPRRFAPSHPFDRIAFPALLGLIWLGMVMGFVPDMLAKQRDPAYHYPLIVHAHAAAFVGWLLLLTAQVTLVRTGRIALHRRLGRAGMGLAGMMMVLGPATALVVNRLQIDTPRADPAFLAIPLCEMAGFTVLATAGLARRRDAAAHKRLMLLATIAMAGAGFGRWWAPAFYDRLGPGFWAELWGDNLGKLLLVGALAGHDVLTRGRPHSATAWGGSLVLLLSLLSASLYVTPAWKPIAEAIIRM